MYQQHRRQQRQRLGLTDALMEVLLRRDIELVEFLSACGLFLWGAWLANPFTHVFEGTRAYALMSDLAPEWVWGSAYMLVGLGQYITLISGSLWWRQSGSMAALAAWSVITYMVTLGNPGGTDTVIYGLLALANVLLVLRIELRKRFVRGRRR
jgi:hypothetical protein